MIRLGVCILQIRYLIWKLIYITVIKVKTPAIILIGLIILGFCIYILIKDFQENIPLLVLLCILFLILIIKLLKKIKKLNVISRKVKYEISKRFRTWQKLAVNIIVFIAFFIFIIVDNVKRSSDTSNLRGFAGILVIFLLAAVLSENRLKITWSTVFYSLTLQLILAVLTLRWSVIRSILSWIGNALAAIGEFADDGSRFVFGKSFNEHSFAMEVMPRMIFFNAISNVLEYYGILQFIVAHIGRIIYYLLGTTPTESFLAAANIFLGPENSIMLIQPMIIGMSRSEFHAVIACGLSAIDAGMVSVYVNFGISAPLLITSSLLSAPAALGLSKILVPPVDVNYDDVDRSRRNINILRKSKKSEASIVHIFHEGAVKAVSIIANILVTLMSFISIVSFVNATFSWLLRRVGFLELTLQKGLAYLIWPLTFLMGIQWKDCFTVGQLIGTKIFINEFVAYSELKTLMENRLNETEPFISERSENIATFALCGFSNFGTLGTHVGFLCMLSPFRKSDVTSVAARGFVAGNLACLLTAAVAGLLI